MEFRNTLDGWFNDDLPDMNQEEPEVARYEIQNALWWIGMTGLDGIRQDTIQYMPRSFIRDLSTPCIASIRRCGWSEKCSSAMRRIRLSSSAATRAGTASTPNWIRFLILPLWNASLLAFTNKVPVRALRDQLKYDALYPDPSKDHDA